MPASEKCLTAVLQRARLQGYTNDDVTVARWIRSQIADDWVHCGSRCRGHCPPREYHEWLERHGSDESSFDYVGKGLGKGGFVDQGGKGNFGDKGSSASSSAVLQPGFVDKDMGNFGNKGEVKSGFDNKRKADGITGLASSSPSSSSIVPPWRAQPLQTPTFTAQTLVASTPAGRDPVVYEQYMSLCIAMFLYHRDGGSLPFRPDAVDMHIAGKLIVGLLKAYNVQSRHGPHDPEL